VQLPLHAREGVKSTISLWHDGAVPSLPAFLAVALAVTRSPGRIRLAREAR
jgi:hypothetical protein